MSFKTNKQRMHESRLSWSLCSFAESRHCFLAGPSERNTHALPQWPSLVWAEASDAYGPIAHAQAFSFLFRVALSTVESPRAISLRLRPVALRSLGGGF